MNEHEFALYVPLLSTLYKNAEVILSDKDLVHRIGRVLRLKQKDSIVLFDKNKHGVGFIKTIERAVVVIEIEKLEVNQAIEPSIVVQVGLLKREALEHVVETLTVFGVDEIQLFMSEKIGRKWGGQKEFDRLERLMIAAAEQSKQFVFPVLKGPVPLLDLLISSSGYKVFCDPQGTSFFDFVAEKREYAMTILIGPEGDLSDKEKMAVCKNNYTTCALTKTILRSELAATLAVGVIRVR